MTPGRAQRVERVVILGLFPAIAWVSVASFVLAIPWDGSSAVLAVPFWLGVVTGALIGVAAGSGQPWLSRHRAGARTAAWWLGAGPIVLLAVLSIVSPWREFFGLVLLACLVVGLALGLPGGLAVGVLARRTIRPPHRRAPSHHE
jgi:peptidoglycan/LPS O-acetylase OafA/YrhL